MPRTLYVRELSWRAFFNRRDAYFTRRCFTEVSFSNFRRVLTCKLMHSCSSFCGHGLCDIVRYYGVAGIELAWTLLLDVPNFLSGCDKDKKVLESCELRRLAYEFCIWQSRYICLARNTVYMTLDKCMRRHLQKMIILETRTVYRVFSSRMILQRCKLFRDFYFTRNTAKSFLRWSSTKSQQYV